MNGNEKTSLKQKLSEHRLLIIRILVLVFVIALTLYLLSIRDQIQDFEQYGYPGLFIVSLLSSATVLIPVPGVIVTSAFGAIFNPLWVAVVAGVGAGLGELSGYLAGFSGRGVVEKVESHKRMERWMAKYGDITVLVLAIVPNPVFDMAGITAGALKLPVWRFLFWVIIGKIIKMLAFAYGGASIVDWFTDL
jgi:membrane protein YqaA with SNARE-associated domain